MSSIPRIVKQKAHEAQLTDKKWYSGTITEIEEKWQVPTKKFNSDDIELQDKLVIHIEIPNGDEPVAITRMCNRSVAKNSTFGGIVYDITGEYPGQDYDIDELEHKPVQVFVVTGDGKNGGTFDNASKFMPALEN